MSSNTEPTETGSSIKVLELHNYHQWSDLMLSYFLEHNLDGIVDGTEELPDVSMPAERNKLASKTEESGWFYSQKVGLEQQGSVYQRQ